MLPNDESLGRATTTRVARGLYVLRYVSGAVSGASPVATVRPAPGCEQSIEVISAPGATPGFLARPGEALVVRAERAGELSIELVRQSEEDSFEAAFNLELVSAAVSSPARAVTHAAAGAPAKVVADAVFGLRLCAHVARRGDVEASAAQWVAGPGAPAPIEGLEIRGVLPAGLQIETQVLIAANPPRWLDWAAPGVFSGTRGRAMPLLGVRLKLVGNAAARFVICAEALFLGAAIVSNRGWQVELVGSGAADPLVGLKLHLSPIEAASVDTEARSSSVTTNRVLEERRIEPRVRVFRAPSNF